MTVSSAKRGDDTLRGGLGDDLLSGGAGADVFVLDSSFIDPIGNDFDDDRILDFNQAEGDLIDVSEFGISSIRTIRAISSLSNDGNVFLTVFEDGDRNRLTVDGVGLNQLLATDFIFDASAAGTTVTGQDEEDDLFGGAGDDNLDGLEGSDRLFGEAGNDVLRGGLGDDTLVGGIGADVFVLDSSFIDPIGNDFDDDRILDFNQTEGDRIDVSEFGISTIETIQRLARIDNSGNLLLTVFEDGDRNRLTLERVGQNQLTAADFIFDASAVGSSITGQDEEDDLFGGAGNDVLNGAQGNDRLFGEAGDDVLRGQLGDDILVGGAGADIFVLDSSFVDPIGNDFDDDRILDFSQAQGDRINVREFDISTLETVRRLAQTDDSGNVFLTVFRDGDRNTLTIEGIGLDQLTAADFVFDGSSDSTTVTGQDEEDDLSGGMGDDTIIGLGGDDRLFGESGNDELQGGAGSDLLFGGTGRDTAVFTGTRADFVVTAANGRTTVEDTRGRTRYVDTLVGIETIQFIDESIEVGEEGGASAEVPPTTPPTPPTEPPEDDPDDMPPGDETPPDSGENPLAQIEVVAFSPSSITATGTDEVTVTYRNTGDTAVAAPLLNLSAEGARFRLTDESEFSESQIQFLGINNRGAAGVLPPGASNRFTVEFMPESAGNGPINFSVSAVDPEAAIDWESLRAQSRPAYITEDAWQQIYNNFVAEVGTTAGDYQSLLAENATYLSELGRYVADASTLLAFEFQQASDFQAISQQNSLGSFGVGKPFVGNIQLSADAQGNVAIDNGGTRRSFELQADGSYQGQPGDNATLVLDTETGLYVLQELDGIRTAFNAAGRLDYIEDPNGNRITATYGNALAPNRLIRLTDNFGNEFVFRYNANDRIISVTAPDGRISTYTYDAAGNNLETITDELGTTTYTYVGSEVASITDPNGTRLEFVYDDRGRISQQRLTSSDGEAETVTYRYDSVGGVTIVDGAGNETALLLNENGQVGQLTDANGRLVSFSYDSQGNLTQLVAPENNTSLFSYDDQGNLTTQVNPLGELTRFAYEPAFNQLASVTDARGNGLAYDYDTAGNLTEIQYADGSLETFEYSDHGEVTASVNRRDQRITYAYNEDGELISEQTPDQSIPTRYTYDVQGYLDTVVDGTGTTDLDYDAAGRLTKITYPSGRSLSYTYDAGDRRTSLTDQDGNRTNYAYDELGRLSRLTDGTDNLIVDYQYDSVGRLSREDKGNGTYTLYTYDAADQLLSIINHAPNGSVNSSAIYTYDDLGRQSSQTTLEGAWTYRYDAVGQLIGAEFDSNTPDITDQSLSYVYDAGGQSCSNG